MFTIEYIDVKGDSSTYLSETTEKDKDSRYTKVRLFIVD